jgi:hypothetical protein
MAIVNYMLLYIAPFLIAPDRIIVHCATFSMAIHSHCPPHSV